VRNFILFIRKFFNLILFLGLESLCIFLVARTNTLQGNDIVSSANVLTGSVYKKQNDVVVYFGLRKMNDSLINENAKLRSQLSLNNGTYAFVKDSIVKRPTGDSGRLIKYADYTYHSAYVLNNSVSYTNNYITINRGTKDGIHNGMAVISGNGAVGRVIHTSGHFATVLSLLSVSFSGNEQKQIEQQLSAKLKDGTQSYVSWDGERADVLIMKDVPQQVAVKKGDSVFTGNFSYYPRDIMIGTVIRIEAVKKNNMQILYLRTATNFRNLQYVYVVDNKYSEEIKTLSDSLKKK